MAGVDGFVKLTEGRVFETGGAFFRGSVHRLEKDLKPKFFVLLYHL